MGWRERGIYKGDFSGKFIIPTALDRHGTIDSHSSGYNATSTSGHDPSKYFDKLSDVAWILSEGSWKAFVPFVAFLAGRAIKKSILKPADRLWTLIRLLQFLNLETNIRYPALPAPSKNRL